MKRRCVMALLCLSLGVLSPGTVLAAGNIESNANMNDETRARIEKAEADAGINMIEDDADLEDRVGTNDLGDLKYTDEVDVVGPDDSQENDQDIGISGATDPVEDGSASTGEYTIVYRDGLDGQVFSDVTEKAKKGDRTPTYIPAEGAYPGYEFESWYPKLEQRVTQSQVYVAQWKKINEGDIDIDKADKTGNVSENETEPVDESLTTPSENKGTSQSMNKSDLDNSGKGDAYADDVDSGDIPVNILIAALASGMVMLGAIGAVLKNRLKK